MHTCRELQLRAGNHVFGALDGGRGRGAVWNSGRVRGTCAVGAGEHGKWVCMLQQGLMQTLTNALPGFRIVHRQI